MKTRPPAATSSMIVSQRDWQCPEGRAERLRIVNENEGLVECEHEAALGCPHAVYFDGRFY
jgi:hypothetical protein